MKSSSLNLNDKLASFTARKFISQVDFVHPYVLIYKNKMSTYEAFKANFSAAETADEHFRRCWAEQACGGCLNSKGCSWCPYVSLYYIYIYYISSRRTDIDAL